MPKMVCGTCEVELKPEQNGIWVIEMADFGPYKIWAADLHKCPNCGHQVVAGFANEPMAEHWEKEFPAMLERIMQGKVPVVYDYESRKQKKKLFEAGNCDKPYDPETMEKKHEEKTPPQQ